MQRQDLGLAVAGVVVTTVVALVLTSTPDGLVADAPAPVLPAAPQLRVQAGPGTSAAVSPAAPRHTGEVAVLHPLAVSALVQRQPAPRPAQAVAAVEAVDGAAGLAKPPTETSADGVRGSTELAEPAGSVLGARPAGVRPRGR